MISEGEDDADSEDEVVKAATNPFGRPSKGIYRFGQTYTFLRDYLCVFVSFFVGFKLQWI